MEKQIGVGLFCFAIFEKGPQTFQMLPSMPILFTRESQDAFGNKIEPSTSYFNQTNEIQPILQSVVSQMKLPILNHFLL